MRIRPMIILAIGLTLSTTTLALEEVEYEVVSAIVAGSAAFQDIVSAGAVEVEVDFLLNADSDGVSPLTEATVFEIEPNPAHSPVEGDPLPCWTVFIPPACFIFGKNRYDVVDPENCGVKVLLRNEATQLEVDITKFITAFEASIKLDGKGGGKAKVELDMADINPVAGEPQPCWLSFRIGNDGLVRLALDSKMDFSGTL